MTGMFEPLLSASVFAFTVCSMLAVGFAYTLQQILAPLRDPWALVRALVANFVLVPMLAFLITRGLALSPGFEVGVILVSCAAGAPFLITLMQAARGDIALSATLLVLLVPVTVVFMPIVVPWLAPEADVSAGRIAVQLVSTMIVPLVIGLGVNAKAPRWSRRLQPIVRATSTVALIVLLAATIALYYADILALGAHAILAALLLVIGAVAIGYMLARPDRRTVLALGTGQRGIAAATMVASQSIEDPDALVMVVLTTVIGMLVLLPLARWRFRR